MEIILAMIAIELFSLGVALIVGLNDIATAIRDYLSSHAGGNPGADDKEPRKP